MRDSLVVLPNLLESLFLLLSLDYHGSLCDWLLILFCESLSSFISFGHVSPTNNILWRQLGVSLLLLPSTLLLFKFQATRTNQVIPFL